MMMYRVEMALDNLKDGGAAASTNGFFFEWRPQLSIMKKRKKAPAVFLGGYCHNLLAFVCLF